MGQIFDAGTAKFMDNELLPNMAFRDGMGPASSITGPFSVLGEEVGGG